STFQLPACLSSCTRDSNGGRVSTALAPPLAGGVGGALGWGETVALGEAGGDTEFRGEAISHMTATTATSAAAPAARYFGCLNQERAPVSAAVSIGGGSESPSCSFA